MKSSEKIFQELHQELILTQGPYMGPDFFALLANDIHWDERIRSRKTASFGLPYNYSGINYQPSKIPVYLDDLVLFVQEKTGFSPNNCLMNYYPDSKAKMGFHSDNIDLLVNGSGIAIFSFGSSRVLRLEYKADRALKLNLNLENESFFYMSQEVQNKWVHAILADHDLQKSGRISITFRQINIH